MTRLSFSLEKDESYLKRNRPESIVKWKSVNKGDAYGQSN